MQFPDYYQRVIQALPSDHTKCDVMINCDDVNHRFHIDKLSLQREEGNTTNGVQWKNYISYYPMKSSVNSILYFDLPTDSSVPHILDRLFEILWKYQMCNECFYLIPMEYELCGHCRPSKMFWEYGLSKQYIEHIPQCMICLEPVYKSKLECGHYVHRTCFIQMNPHDHFEDEDDLGNLTCPCCRRLITTKDKITYFLTS